jgi:hypothetical protein
VWAELLFCVGEGSKFGFFGMFRLAQTPVGSDALVAPPHKTHRYVLGVEVKNIDLTKDKGNFQVAERPPNKFGMASLPTIGYWRPSHRAEQTDKSHFIRAKSPYP